MSFKRVWDSSCPRVYDSWEADGRSWVIQDLAPEDDERAVEILINHLAKDEPLCKHNDITNDPESVACMWEVWRKCLAERTSVACYTEVDGKKTLVALNCCIVACKDNKEQSEPKGKAWKRVIAVMKWMESKISTYEHFGVDKYLSALGLVVMREFRGAKLGGRLLKAREPLCRLLGVRAAGTVFTAPAAQRLAEKCGYVPIFEATWADLADAGMDYPRNDNVVKYMVKKIDD